MDLELESGRIIREATEDFTILSTDPNTYVVRSSVSPKTMDTDQTVRSYKLLSNVERAFRRLESVD